MDRSQFTDKQLLARASRLQSQAEALYRSKLLPCFPPECSPVLVGGAATGLMTKPDIDITILLEPLSFERLAEIARRFICSAQIGRMTLIDLSVIPWHNYHQGLFCNLRLRSGDELSWNIDLWAYAKHDYSTAIAAHQDLAYELSRLDPFLVLRTKADYPELEGHEIYEKLLKTKGEKPELFKHCVFDIPQFKLACRTHVC